MKQRHERFVCPYCKSDCGYVKTVQERVTMRIVCNAIGDETKIISRTEDSEDYAHVRCVACDKIVISPAIGVD